MVRHPLITLAAVTLVVSLFLPPAASRAQWQPDGTAVCTDPQGEYSPQAVSDGSGGAIVTWQDFRSGSDYDIYAGRMDAQGVPQWNADGVPLCTAANSQYSPKIVSDGAGGAIVTWYDYRNGSSDIYAQRVDASGTPLWTSDGVALCTVVNAQVFSEIVSDGAGGAIVVWEDFRSGSYYDIYAQRISASGTPLWTAGGVALCTAAYDQSQPVITSDGAGGAIVSWVDFRSNTNNDIYAQRVNASGTPQWASNGVALCTAANDQIAPVITSDNSGGAIVAWEDFRTGTDYDIYAQRVNASGVSQWNSGGVGVCAYSGSQDTPAIVSDGAGGAIVTWEDYRSGTNYDAYAQRVSAFGKPEWANGGVALRTLTTGGIAFPSLVSDGAGGAIVVWQDYRSGGLPDVYTQRVNGSGAPQWTTNGVAVCTAAGGQYGPSTTAVSGGAIVVWADARSGVEGTYAERIESTYGYWGHPEPIVTSVADIPNDQGGKVAINWEASGRDRAVPRTIDHYSIWRAVDSLSVSQSAPILSDISSVGKDTKGPVYARFSSAPDYYFELVGTQAAQGWPGYSYAAPTRADSVGTSPGDEVFMVAAHYMYDYYVAFASNTLSGHSVDNLAPAAPLYLMASRAGTDVDLHWRNVSAGDLKDYAVYRATSSGVTPVAGNFLATATDTVLVDSGAPLQDLYYIVTAVDVHGNESVASNEANVSGTTGVGQPPALTRLEVLPNYPNPFRGETELEIGLPVRSDVRVSIYDVAGRRVGSVAVHDAAAGWLRVPFGGLDLRGEPLASGVYFYRVTADGMTVTKKMVIAR